MLADLIANGDRAGPDRGDGRHADILGRLFATVSGGRITDLVEVWTDAGQEPPPSRAAAQ